MTEQLNLTEMAGEGLLENPYLLVALFDQYDILRAANPPFCETYGGRTDGSMSWQQLMRENYEQQRGVRILADDMTHGYVQPIPVAEKKRFADLKLI